MGFAPGATVDVSMVRRGPDLARVLELVLDAPRDIMSACFGGVSLVARADREIVFAAVSKLGSALQDAAVELKADREIVLAAVSQDGYALKYAAEELRSDQEIVMVAVSNNGYALQYAV